MARFLLVAVAFVVVLYAFIDALMTRGSDVRTLPRALWIVLIVLLPVLGAVGWFVWGRPRASAGGGGLVPGRGRGPVAPDDDPAFLRKLEDEAWRENLRRRRAQREGGTDGDAHHDDPGPAVDSGSPGSD